MDDEARILLDDTIEFCRRDGRETRLINMLEQCAATALDDDSLTIEAPSRFAYSYLMRQRELIERYLEEIAFAPLSLIVSVAGTHDGEGAAAPRQQPAPQVESDRAAAPGADAPAPVAPAPTERPARGINVTNTVSADDFRRMMSEMKQNEATPRRAGNAGRAEKPSRGAAPAADAAPEPAYPAVGVSSKFTFETFVFGDENKHAYQSSLRFAAFADEPGTCTSLFIYGNSGLGKTHLLFAIKNYLAQEKPYIRVKYANSQAYLDDYMHDLGMQKGPGDPIMRAYREADILIIDDIQNIIGKQASIEYFFQLMDEFLRTGKKIVIASDRAPKKLGLDERLTSRFNAGMLCLVSEPGFEMKYAILKRYYETIILGSNDLSSMNVDTSLLSAVPVSEGHLSDAHLRHMAEISGSNIRELESFCERCAGLSFEREEAGGELTGEDIDRVADEYFDTAHKVVHIDTVQSVVEEYYHVSHEELIGPRRTANIAFARHAAVYLANELCEAALTTIGAEFGGRDHSTVINSLKVVEKKMKGDRRICEEIQQLKNTILLKA